MWNIAPNVTSNAELDDDTNLKWLYEATLRPTGLLMVSSSGPYNTSASQGRVVNKETASAIVEIATDTDGTTAVKSAAANSTTAVKSIATNRAAANRVAANRVAANTGDNSTTTGNAARLLVSTRSATRKTVACTQCGKQFSTASNRNRHILSEHTQLKRFKCREGCDKKFARAYARNGHENTVHRGLRLFECPAGCGAKFGERRNATRHYKEKHENKKRAKKSQR